MVKIELTDDALILRLSGWNALWACRRRFTVPRACIAEVRKPTDNEQFDSPGLRMGGTCLPYVIVAGHYWNPFWESNESRWSFYAIRGYDNAIRIGFRNFGYRFAMVEPTGETAEDAIERIRAWANLTEAAVA